MRALIEISGFCALATLAHFAVWPAAPDVASVDGGAGGQMLVSVTPSGGALQTLVESWQRPPNVLIEQSETQADAPSISPAQRAFPSLHQTPSAIAMPRLSMVPDAPRLPHVQVAPESKSKPATKLKSKPRSDTKAAKPKAINKNREASKAQTKRVAKGAPKNAPRATISAAQKKALLARWGGQIRSRLARRAPRGAGKGTTIVHLTVSSGGKLLNARVAKSSGSNKLDRLALAAVKKAGRFPAAPRGLRVTQYTFGLPVTSK